MRGISQPRDPGRFGPALSTQSWPCSGSQHTEGFIVTYRYTEHWFVNLKLAYFTRTYGTAHGMILNILLRTSKRKWASLLAPSVKNLPAMQHLDQEDPLEKETATHASILAWEFPWTEEPGEL